VKNEDEFVDRSFELPESCRHVIKCRDSGLIRVLNGVVHSNIIQSLNAGDIDGAVSHINSENVDTETNIIEAVIQGLSIKLNNLQVELRYANDTIFVNDDIRMRKIDRITSETKDIERKIDLVKRRIHDSELCTICLEKPSVKTITKCCNNSFCLKCITSWARRIPKCPLCKASIMMDRDVFVVKDTTTSQSVGDEYPTKMQFLGSILEKADEKSRILIFSEHDNSFLDIEKLLQRKSISYSRLKGNGINKSVIEYKSGSLQVLLVNSSSYGSGLNLENTSDVILFHKFDNDIENQIIGRAQRPGRTERLNVWYLLNANEYDQMI
jgi:SNF2 family DNA or RNA helicase